MEDRLTGWVDELKGAIGAPARVRSNGSASVPVRAD